MGGAESTPVVPEGARLKKIYLHFEEGDEANHLTLKLTIPSKWSGATVDRLKEFFLETYNERRPENKVDPNAYHLERTENRVIRGDETIHDTIKNRDDIYVKIGPSTFKHKKDLADEERERAAPKDLVQCKNFGCRDKFNPADNHASACKHHTKPPTFHDTKKGWQCCTEKLVYDWEQFELIEPCAVGFHSTTGIAPPKEERSGFGAPVLVVPAPAPMVKSIDDYNQKNPSTVTAVPKPKPVVVRTDGKAKCVNFGCQKEYVVADNDERACPHHVGAPVFRDAGKHWSCCPKIVKYDFDEFLKIPPCVVTAHTDQRV
ncbi:hypothetical protein H257_13084 [Aphanomyces astaci]|uniref:CHORD domain-containing protein n=1 Tax=Aphanomyces astaci TaxID=112090 RepID=W4FXX7_APHAT|nr:hypothetical protein H257_13084 [Aphanomyces astaci]ETV71624.1 hypothetical protein H257_13084 [Aphanomyces astaci]RQM10516.1 hypothetical protein B5M09_011764 [Aphanomyces astaci]|eukprot:XP_009838812.1 hypothetical protein H257_13084 [Aphanomyces astaci]